MARSCACRLWLFDGMVESQFRDYKMQLVYGGPLYDLAFYVKLVIFLLMKISWCNFEAQTIWITKLTRRIDVYILKL